MTDKTILKSFAALLGVCVFSTVYAGSAVLEKVINDPAPAKELCSYNPAKGVLPGEVKGWKSSYEDGRLIISQEKTLVINNESTVKKYATITHQIPGELKRKGVVAVIEWQSRVLRSSRFGFILGFTFKSPVDRKNHSLYIMQNRNSCNVPGKKISLPMCEFASFKAYVDLDSADYVLFCNGKKVSEGKLQVSKATELLYFGDGSGNCEGMAELKFCKLSYKTVK